MCMKLMGFDITLNFIQDIDVNEFFTKLKLYLFR